MKKLGQLLSIIAFIIPITFFSITSIFDKDQEVSEKEKRTLTKKPSFTLDSYFKGSYTLNFTDYFSDNFPFRNTFLDANKKLLSFYTETNSDGVQIVTAKKTDLGSGEALKPSSSNTESSVSSNSSSSEIPQSSSSEQNPPNIPPPTSVEDVNSILIADNRAMEYYTIAPNSLKDYANSLNTLQKNCPGVKVYNILAPTSIEFYSPEEYHTGSHSEKEAINIAYSALNGAIGVDSYSQIVKHIDEYLYFRTDHHWTARGAYYAYLAFSKSAGFDPVDINSLQSGKIDGFVGTMYSYTESDKLLNNPDYVEYFLPKVETNCMVYSDTSMTNGYQIDVITTNINSSNKYLAFITGDTPLLHITTNLKNGKKILVTKESYGNALVPFLVNNYEEVYVVDPRQLSMSIPSFVKEKGIGEILCVNFLFVPTNAKWMDSFNNSIN